MITGWILVVLQVVGPYSNGWQPIGNFAHKAECEDAVIQMQATAADAGRPITTYRYLCIRQSRSSN